MSGNVISEQRYYSELRQRRVQMAGRPGCLLLSRLWLSSSLITKLRVGMQVCSVWAAAHLPLPGPGLVPAVLCGGGGQGQLLRQGPAGADPLRPVALHPRQDHLAHRRLHHAGPSPVHWSMYFRIPIEKLGYVWQSFCCLWSICLRQFS